ncbi:Cytochrome c oxidase assembly factor 7 [Cichlidogyrus casuarinus]|uniref:Cytochrome c oxidase assembly factor 7 n=1 Tax=Cichlidogyrus casuarinus TaxID=1844966 RepID=A0ABD2QDJ1_9PLAT
MDQKTFGSDDSGLLKYKTVEEAREDLEELGLKFEYGCRKEKNPQLQNTECYSLGQWYQSFKNDPKLAAEIFKKTCLEMDFKESCMKHAYLSTKGYADVKPDLNMAYESLDHACSKLKDMKSCTAIGLMFIEGILGHGPAPTEALKYFEKACSLKSPQGCFHYGGLLYSRADKFDEKTCTRMKKNAVEAWKKACEYGNPYGCKNVAKAYLKGDFVSQNQKMADQYNAMAKKLLD